MLFKSKGYEEGYRIGYQKAISDVMKILNKHDMNPDDQTKFSIKCFKDVRKLSHD